MATEEEHDKCEGCGAPATCFDSDGVSLCRECFQTCIDDAEPKANVIGLAHVRFETEVELGPISPRRRRMPFLAPEPVLEWISQQITCGNHKPVFGAN